MSASSPHLSRRRLLGGLPLGLLLAGCAAPPLASGRPISMPIGSAADIAAGYSFSAPGRLAALDARIRAEGVNNWVGSANDATKRIPNACARVHIEGGLPGQPDYDVGMVAKRDWPVFLLLATAWRGARDQRHLEAYQRFLRAWFSVYQVSGNPIDEEGFDLVLMSFDLMRPDLPPGDRDLIERFLVRLSDAYLAYLERTRGDTLWSVVNNFSSHRVKLATLASYALGDATRVRRSADAFVFHAARNIRADGHTMDFDHRNAIHYHLYSVFPMVMAAASAWTHGANWFDIRPDGAGSVRDGVDWMMPYVEGTKTHEEFKDTNIAFDRIRGEVGVAGFKGLFDPAKAMNLMTVVSHLDAVYNAPKARLQQRVASPEYRSFKMILPPAT